MNIKIIVASHKPYVMPPHDMYLPVFVGRELNKRHMLVNWQKDNEGENISIKNPNYCELTALYWAWKNLDADYIGLAHYRRHFKGNASYDEWSSVLDPVNARHILSKYPVILPKQRNYYIETTYTQYIHAHNKQDLDITYQIIENYYPHYLSAWNEVMNSKKGHRFNMFVMRKDIFDAYCSWLFDVLFKVEEVLDFSNYSDNDKRVLGFIAERLLDVWILTNRVNYTELPVMNMEGEDWLKKGTAFLKRKFIGKK